MGAQAHLSPHSRVTSTSCSPSSACIADTSDLSWPATSGTPKVVACHSASGGLVLAALGRVQAHTSTIKPLTACPDLSRLQVPTHCLDPRQPSASRATADMRADERIQ
jgi:hypothetical protein